MPWYSLLGNHEVLRQGFAPGAHPAFDDALATGCRKTFPSDAFGPAQLGARSQGEALERLASPEVLAQLERDSQPVIGDPARRIVGKAELKAHGKPDRRHGFGFVDRGEQRRSAGSAAYYAWSPRPGLRMIALDTSAEGGRSQGNLDDPQYRWLARELDRNTSVRIRLPRARTARRRSQPADRGLGPPSPRGHDQRVGRRALRRMHRGPARGL